MNESLLRSELRPAEAAAAVPATEAITVTTEIVSHCPYCTMISPDPQYNTPVHCIKFSGSCNPVLVNLATCLSCGEYKKH